MIQTDYSMSYMSPSPGKSLLMNNRKSDSGEIPKLSPEEQLIRTIEQLEATLNVEIGFSFWKRYVAGAVWSNMSTPINFALTLMTAVMTGQATTTNLISESSFSMLSVATLVLSTINTFFRPHIQAQNNMDNMKVWAVLGNEFQELYHHRCFTLDQLQEKEKGLNKVLEKVYKQRSAEPPTFQNFVTDLVFLICRRTCMKNKQYWINPSKIKKIGELIILKKIEQVKYEDARKQAIIDVKKELAEQRRDKDKGIIGKLRSSLKKIDDEEEYESHSVSDAELQGMPASIDLQYSSVLSSNNSGSGSSGVSSVAIDIQPKKKVTPASTEKAIKEAATKEAAVKVSASVSKVAPSSTPPPTGSNERFRV